MQTLDRLVLDDHSTRIVATQLDLVMVDIDLLPVRALNKEPLVGQVDLTRGFDRRRPINLWGVDLDGTLATSRLLVLVVVPGGLGLGSSLSKRRLGLH